MSKLIKLPPYSKRDDEQFLKEMNLLTKQHFNGCKEYRSLVDEYREAKTIEELLFLHVGLFKIFDLKTDNKEITHTRVLLSSSTSGIQSRIQLDKISSQFQNHSSTAILKDYLGTEKRPLLLIDSLQSLLKRSEISARIAAAMSLKPFASKILFILENSEDPNSMKWKELHECLESNDDLIIYGFSWILWLVWCNQELPQDIRKALKGKRIYFVHSGGWKKIESININKETFDRALLKDLDPNSKVIDYYGLVEQIGIIFPLCEYGYRHVPVWTDVIVRESISMKSINGEPGQLQLMNTLAQGAPYHNVLTEDLAYIAPGPCECGRFSKKFKLLGRIPNTEIRGCANV